jgi:hypothetical protein
MTQLLSLKSARLWRTTGRECLSTERKTGAIADKGFANGILSRFWSPHGRKDMSSTPLAPCHVFTPDWIAQKVQRYGSLPSYVRPRHLEFWTSEDAQDWRHTIEQLVDDLPPETRRRVIPRVRAPEHFEQTWNELFVGDSIRRLGHRAEYEPEMEGLTPDWLVNASIAGRFIIEVVSSKPPSDRKRCDAAWEQLRRRVLTLPGNAWLAISPPIDFESFAHFAAPPVSRQKQIVREIREWLKTNPLDEDSIIIDEIEIKLLGKKPDLHQVACSIGLAPFEVNGETLKIAVKEKASKYKRVVNALGMPFVVCVVMDFSSGRDFRDLEDAVLGNQGCRLRLGPGGTHRPEYYRESNGLFARYRTLSAVSMAQWNRDRISHKVLVNPNALYAFDQSALTRWPEDD